MRTCPTGEEILLARHAELEPRRVREVLRHVARCPRCRQEDAALRLASGAFAHRLGGSRRLPGPTRHATPMVTPASILLAIATVLLVLFAGVRVQRALRENSPPPIPATIADDCQTPAQAAPTTVAPAHVAPITVAPTPTLRTTQRH
jgi:hypothetical protein